MAETPEKNEKTGPAKATPAQSAPVASAKSSLSEKAEKLAARLEAHKLQQPKPADGSETTAEKPAASGSAPATVVQPAVAGSGTTSSPAGGASAAAKAGTTNQEPARRAPEAAGPVEDVIRAIKLPHEVAAEKQAKSAKADTKPATQVAPAIEVPPVTVAAGQEKPGNSAAVVAEARNRVFGTFTPEPEPSEAAMKRRVARERALSSKPPLARTAQALLAIIFPFLILMTAIRLVASPVFLALAYARPGFPSDQFGFTDAQRLTFGSYGVDYLNNFAGPQYLSGLRLDNGAALFSAAEVQHMVDVKNLIGVGYVSGVILAVLGIVLVAYLLRRYAGGVRRGLFAGAVATLGLLGLLVASAILGWQAFFTRFHELFFSEGTWTFAASDTLIRLYPEQFWIDSAITVAALVILAVIIVLITCWPTGRRREAARLRQDARVFGLGNN